MLFGGRISWEEACEPQLLQSDVVQCAQGGDGAEALQGQIVFGERQSHGPSGAQNWTASCA
jgi:hypothetical protein